MKTRFREATWRWLSVLGALGLASCAGEDAAVLPGTVEWDRVAVLAETMEPIREVRVQEGETVRAGDVLLRLDTRRADAELAAAQGERDAARAQLAALRQGARSESIEAAAGELARLSAQADNAAREHERARDLNARGLLSPADLDRSESNATAAAAARRSAEARLRELQRGNRREDIEAGVARLAAAEARVQALGIARDRLTVVAPRDGRVDALPFRAGDQPAPGAVLVSLMAGDAPWVRVYVPATQRAATQPGTRFRVTVEGVAEPFEATLRSIRAEPAFTPYYALVGDDAARLVYRAELLLQGEAARALPAGLPASATRVDGGAP